MRQHIVALFVVLLGSVLFLGPGSCPPTPPGPCVDADGDGFCNGPSLEGERPMEVDCDDSNPEINPDAAENWFVFETCLDGLDNDCDSRRDLKDLDCPAGQDPCALRANNSRMPILDRVLTQCIVYSVENEGREVSQTRGITVGDLRDLKHLVVDRVTDGRKITQLSSLMCSRKMQSVILPGQLIENIWALADLPSLRTLDLRDNLVEKLWVLLQEGMPPNLRKVDLRGNPLDERSCKDSVPWMTSRGIEVLSDCH